MIIKNYTSQGIVSSTFFSVLSKVIPIIISFISLPIIIKALGDEKYGALTIAMVFIGYFNLFDLGLGRAITKLISENIGNGNEQDIGDIYKTGMLTSLFLGVLGGVVFFFVSEPITISYIKPPKSIINEITEGLIYLSIGFPFSVLINSSRGTLEAFHEFKAISFIQITFGIITYGGIIWILLITTNLGVIIGYLSVVKIINLTVYFFISQQRVNTFSREGSFKSDLVKKLFSYGGWVTISTIVGPIMTAFDRIIIASKTGMESVAYYSTSNEVTQRIGVLPTALVNVLFPVFSKNQKINSTQNVKLYQASFSFTLLFSLVFGIIFISFGEDIIAVWINEDFASNSSQIFRIIVFGSIFNFLARIPFTFIQGIGRPDITAKFHIIELPLYLVLLFFLTSSYGLIGASIATSVRMILDFLFLHLYSILKFKARPNILVIILGVSVLCLCFYTISNREMDIFLRLFLMIGLTLLLLLFFWRRVFDNELKSKIYFLIKNYEKNANS